MKTSEHQLDGAFAGFFCRASKGMAYITALQRRRGYRNGQPLLKTQALLGTLKKVDGIIHGWGKHYRFCNDQRCFENLDKDVAELVRDYLGFYSDERRNTVIDRAPML